MANDYFRFKQFAVQQDQCAMKVCTDSCLFGAYITVGTAQSILDIGTGTGLLALMLAQRSPAQIDAVEIDPAAARQATENVAASPWSDRIRVWPQSLQDFAAGATERYHLIVSNPPFFQASLKSPVAARTTARHTTTLRWEELLEAAHRLLQPEGSMWIMLPPPESVSFAMLAQEQGWHLTHRLEVLTQEAGKPLRWVQSFAKKPQPFSKRTLAIRTRAGEYTEAFRELLQPYYLYL